MGFEEVLTSQGVQVLFSFLVTGYLLVRLETTIKQNTASIYALRETIEKK